MQASFYGHGLELDALARRTKLWLHRWLMGLLLCAGVPAAVSAETIVLEPIRDATLIESSDGAWANGSGPVLFAGHTSSIENGRRRALVAFDVAAAVPAGAWVTRAELRLELTHSNPAPADVRLHRVTSSWSEGPSVAGGGGGAASEPGDTTWIHTAFPTRQWTTPGGDFAPAPSASTTVGGAGPYAWASTPSTVEDVQGWLDNPSQNQGWIVIGNEGALTTAKRFVSREASDAAMRPRLVVEFESSCESAGSSRSALGLCRAYCEAIQCWREEEGNGRACERLKRNFTRITEEPRLPCESD